ncbi:hypothetical protein PV10_07185 [Exophiala mesophila]|uniref:Yeast cell wall synthesis Kre9/Knh1-like N-terminal domain-containing protein n=1 Tax=Exophiala mesophila TaxID=212818 RepID=A0A0D1ZSJ7_EXOME|nr:uncharacterized protein PV10_07185 [Exophiala mesophila]KIV89813.1 hypothetical protein PV10_07185 [Exophiala mesophila]
MLAKNLFVVGAALVASAFAQGRLAFTSTPGTAVQGSTYNISWSGGDGSAVTLTLRKGDPNDLETIGILGQSIMTDSYVWEVSDSLEPDDDYALQITQRQDVINYSGLFSIIAGNSTAASTTTPPSNSSSSTTTFIGSSAGTGTALPRNTTFSSPTISPTTSLEPAVTQHETQTESVATTTTPAATTAAGASATTSAPVGGSAAQLASSMALVMGVFAAIMFSN